MFFGKYHLGYEFFSRLNMEWDAMEWIGMGWDDVSWELQMDKEMENEIS